MENQLKPYISRQIQEANSIIAKMLCDPHLLESVENAAIACISALTSGRKILLAGNGGSAADAQHIAGELVSRFRMDRPALAALALSTDTSVITALGNDFSYSSIFSRQIQAHGQEGDIFIAYSTSGRSSNIIDALEEARRLNMISIGMTGANSSRMKVLCDSCVQVPSTDTPRVQECHAIIGHVLCDIIESQVFNGG